jgi:hypothetical protein
MEDARANEQAADFVRQEKILKLISNELTKNTTRVVEMAVKSEVQNSVLPSLETITKNEVKAALGNQIAKGVTESIKQVTCPPGSVGPCVDNFSLSRASPPRSNVSSCDRKSLRRSPGPLWPTPLP